MILTGKAKKDFIKWLYFKHNLQPYNLFNEIIQYALIIEWFDSVGIYISINYVDFYDEFKNNTGFETYVTNKGLSVKFRIVSIRQEATEQAIKKANEIYNNKN
jgi:hypothetical protein